MSTSLSCPSAFRQPVAICYWVLPVRERCPWPVGITLCQRCGPRFTKSHPRSFKRLGATLGLQIVTSRPIRAASRKSASHKGCCFMFVIWIRRPMLEWPVSTVSAGFPQQARDLSWEPTKAIWRWLTNYWVGKFFLTLTIKRVMELYFQTLPIDVDSKFDWLRSP